MVPPRPNTSSRSYPIYVSNVPQTVRHAQNTLKPARLLAGWVPASLMQTVRLREKRPGPSALSLSAKLRHLTYVCLVCLARCLFGRFYKLLILSISGESPTPTPPPLPTSAPASTSTGDVCTNGIAGFEQSRACCSVRFLERVFEPVGVKHCIASHRIGPYVVRYWNVSSIPPIAPKILIVSSP